MARIYLSPPHMEPVDRALMDQAFESNWIAPCGPDIEAFEQEFAQVVAVAHACALSSGTAALHLALVALDIQPGSDVIVSTLTFAATANAVRYVGGNPVFVDCNRSTWTLDPDLLAEALADSKRRGKIPRAVIAVDLYGQSADYERIVSICDSYDVPVVQDAAEALGASYRGRPVGAQGVLAAFSFNGNKIVTTSGGGMLVSNRLDLIQKARHLANQARDPTPHYEHSCIGYNYRLSNLLAALGRGQLRHLDDRVRARRANFDAYVGILGQQPGWEFMPEADYGRGNRWLSCALIDPDEFGADRDAICRHLDLNDIEARPIWKPMHEQPVFRDCRTYGGAVSSDLFRRGICLPSGSALTRDERQRVIDLILELRATGKTSKSRQSA